MEFDPNKYRYSKELLLEIYQNLLKPRVFEEKMLVLLRQGKIGKWFSGIGQEALSVGSAMAMQADEFILPMHRNLGVFTTRGVPTPRLIGQFQAKDSGFTHGRDRSFHFGSLEHKIVGMISHLGPQLSIAGGIALATKLQQEKKATLVFTGEGATSQGEFHEALNVASVWNLPVIFLIENNGYALSTPVKEQYACLKLSDRGIGYGMEAVQIDGNNILEVYSTLSNLASSIRQNPRPILVECLSFRMRGHEEASGTKYVPQELLESWALKDPLLNFQKYLLDVGILFQTDIDQLRDKYKMEVEHAVEMVSHEPVIIPNIDQELNDVYIKTYELSISEEISHPHSYKNLNKHDSHPNLRYMDAIRQGLFQGMEKFDNLVLMGQDIAEYGGAFKVTEGIFDKFGKERVRNTPLCESAIIGIGLGLAIKGNKSVIEMQFADFVSVGFNQIVNNLAKIHYRWGVGADVVIRMPTGAGTAAGPFHSQSNEAWFIKTPGLKVVYPAFPYDAKGLLLQSIEDPNPVLFFEHKFLYRSLTGEVPENYYTIPFGKGVILKEGTDLTIITYGMGVHWASEFLHENVAIKAELLDLRTLIPWDKELVMKSVRKTGKVLILHEDTLTGGFGGEIAAYIAEFGFDALDAPIMRCASLDTPVPSNGDLENQFLAKARLSETVQKLLKY